MYLNVVEMQNEWATHSQISRLPILNANFSRNNNEIIKIKKNENKISTKNQDEKNTDLQSWIRYFHKK